MKVVQSILMMALLSSVHAGACTASDSRNQNLPSREQTKNQVALLTQKSSTAPAAAKPAPKPSGDSSAYQ